MPHIDLTTAAQSMASMDDHRQFAMTPGDATTVVYLMSTDTAGATTGGVVVAVLNAANPMVRIRDSSAFIYYTVPTHPTVSPPRTAPAAVWVDAESAPGSAGAYWTVTGPSPGTPWTTSHTLAAGELAPFDTTGGALTATLPTAVGIAGQRCAIKDAGGSAGSHNITVATTSGQTVDGTSPAAIASGHACSVYVSDGANWLVER